MSDQDSPIQALQRQKLLLKMEYFEEKEAFRKQTEATGLQRKIKRGDAWYPLTIGKSYYNSLNQKVLEVFRTNEQGIEHNFEFGKPVVLFSISKTKEKNSIHYFNFTGTVSFVEGDRMAIIVPDTEILSIQTCTNPVGVQLFFDETSYRLMFDALDRVINAKDNRLAYLRDLFYSHRQAGRFTFAPTRFPWLNPTQEKAVNEVLWAKDVAVVHGPPGTGKTTTLVEAINATLMRENQVLVCAQSNMAVDWICEKLDDRGINVLRIGNPTRVTDRMLSSTYERRFEDDPDYPSLWAIRRNIRELRQHRKKGEHQKLERLKSKAIELELRIRARLFSEARVIACTLTGSANHLLEGQKYATLFIDEAAQALEAACWIPMRKCTRVIFAGDHCQLPPTVKSLAAVKAGLGKTLMERIVKNKPEVVTLLKVQYRMNDQIMHFSSEWFYKGQVVSAPQVRQRGILDYDHPMMWIDTKDFSLDPEYKSNEESETEQPFHEEFVGSSFGRINKAEAELTLNTLENYFGKIGKQRILDEEIDTGIISPYRAQVQYLRKLIHKRAFFKPYRSLITVNTVDGFQGQERDIILISMVRSNEDKQIGFLNDLRRMNVAITRARMKLVILGDASTLTKHPFYLKLWNYIQDINKADHNQTGEPDPSGKDFPVEKEKDESNSPELLQDDLPSDTESKKE
ncbi:MAG: AAA domain-containing protein [Prevotella sp.]|jgi:superfamily I DNA and/or RNA helicase|nr:AAA domain-containing protein [Prevotella sp.]MCI1246295.1 AAA domain-containing protein [Prevotella sp.]